MAQNAGIYDLLAKIKAHHDMKMAAGEPTAHLPPISPMGAAPTLAGPSMMPHPMAPHPMSPPSPQMTPMQPMAPHPMAPSFAPKPPPPVMGTMGPGAMGGAPMHPNHPFGRVR